MVDKAVGYGYRNVVFVLDRGYFSRGNIKYMEQLCGQSCFRQMIRTDKSYLGNRAMRVQTDEAFRAKSIQERHYLLLMSWQRWTEFGFECQKFEKLTEKH